MDCFFSAPVLEISPEDNLTSPAIAVTQALSNDDMQQKHG